MIATDHSPCLPEMNRIGDGSFLGAWGGISSIQCRLLAVSKEASARGIGREKRTELTYLAPARLAGLDGRTGAISPGYDANLVVFDHQPEWRLEVGDLFSRHPVSPYWGRTLKGRVLPILLRGNKVYGDGRHSDRPLGQRCFRTRSKG